MAGFPDCILVVRKDPEGLRSPGGERRLEVQNGRSRSTEFKQRVSARIAPSGPIKSRPGRECIAERAELRFVIALKLQARSNDVAAEVYRKGAVAAEE